MSLPGDEKLDLDANLLFNPEGTRLAVAGGGKIRVWDLASKTARTWSGRGMAGAFLTADELLIHGEDTRLRRWHVVSGRETICKPDSNLSFPSRISPDGGLVAFARGISEIELWNLRTGKLALRLPSRGDVWNTAPFSEDGRLFASEHDTDLPQIAVWDLRNRRIKRRLPGVLNSGGNFNILQKSRFSPDGSLLAAYPERGKRGLQVWDIEMGARVADLIDSQMPAWSSDGRFLATVNPGRVTWPDGTSRNGDMALVKIWEVAHLAPSYVLDRPIQSLTFRGDGQQVAANGTIWNVADRGDRVSLRRATEQTAPDFATLCPGGPWAIQRSLPEVGGASKPLKLTHLAAAGREIVLPSPKSPPAIASPAYPELVAFHPDRKSVAVFWKLYKSGKGWISDTAGDQLEVWNLDKPKPQARFAVSCSRMRNRHQLVFDARGEKLALPSNEGITIYDAADGKILNHLDHAEVTAAQIQKDGKSVHHSEQRRTVPIRCVAFSPHGQLVYSGNEEGKVNIGAVEKDRSAGIAPGIPLPESPLAIFNTGKEIASWKGHRDAVLSLAISPDGRTLATGGQGPHDSSLGGPRRPRAGPLGSPHRRRHRSGIQPGWRPARIGKRRRQRSPVELAGDPEAIGRSELGLVSVASYSTFAIMITDSSSA